MFIVNAQKNSDSYQSYTKLKYANNSFINKKINQIKNYIPVLIASTGSNLEAEMAGKIPEINPMIPANPVPSSTLPIPRTNSKSNALVNPKAIPQTNNKPIAPPITDKIIASNKN